MRCFPTLALLFSATAAIAQPVITSVTPNSGPVAGGTQVTITGSGFNDPCAPPKACPVKGLNVYFGSDLAASSTFIDGQTVVAVTPPHLPGTFAVGIVQLDGGNQLSNAFTFQGEPEDAFARLLFPIFVEPTTGAFGSLFITSATMWNKFDVSPIAVYGITRLCCIITGDPHDAMMPVPLTHSQATALEVVGGTPGRILYVPKQWADGVAANLRVADISHSSQTAGTEIPVVRDADFRTDSIALLGVPWNSNFRNTLRIYSAYPDALPVVVTFGDSQPATLQPQIRLTPGATIFDPAYAVITDFPPPPAVLQPGVLPLTMTIRIDAIQQMMPMPPVAHPNRIWAFVSSTNNLTQQITIVSPQ